MNISELQHTVDSKKIFFRAGWAKHIARPGIDPRMFFRKKGGKWIRYSLSYGRKGEYILPEEKKEKDSAHAGKSITVQDLIRAAEMARARGQKCANGEDRSRLEELGISINILRRSKQIDLNLLASQIPCKIEELIALEAGFLPCERVCRLLPAVARHLGVNIKEYVPDPFKFVTPI